MSNSIYFKSNVLLLAAVQSALGVAQAVTSDNIIFANSIDVKLENTAIDQKAALPGRGGARSKFINAKATVTIEAELAHGGVGGSVNPTTPPNLEPLLKSCAMVRAANTTYTSGTSQAGNRSSLFLASGASSTDGFYNGRSISCKIISGSAQAPGSSDLNIVKLASAIAEHTGTVQSGTTTTEIVLASTASDEDDYYVGRLLKIGSTTKAITAYDGATQTATVQSAFGSTPSGTYYILYQDDALNGYTLQHIHYTGTVTDTGSKPSTKTQLYFPSATVGTQNMAGMYVEVTTGSNDPETVRIGAYDTVTKKATLQTSLAIEPTSSSTFRVLEKATIVNYDQASVTATLNQNLRKASVSGAAYEIFETRLIVDYNGTTKRATVAPAFSRWIGEVDYTLAPYFQYKALANSKTEVAATLHFNMDGQLTKLYDAKGTATFMANKGGSLMVKATLTGLLDTVLDSAMPSDLTANKLMPSLPVNAANTRALSVLGIDDAVLHKFEADLGNTVVYQNAPGAERVIITERQSKLAATIDRVAVADMNLREKIEADSMEPVWLAVGNMGEQVTFFFESVLLKNATPSDADGVVTDDLDMIIVETNGGQTGFILTFN